MGAIVYYLVLPFVYCISLLPFPVLYLLSDGLYIIIFHIAGYRKEVVYNNLRNSFPEKTEAEILALRKKYYHHLCDLTLETFKTLTISKAAMLKRCQFDQASFDMLEKMAAENKSLVLVMGHLGNWEWAGNTVSLTCRHKLYVIYHPLSNPYFDRLMYRMRSRFGTGLIPMKDTFREMVARRGELSITAFIADQTPGPTNAHWMTFLNQDTPVFKGCELVSRKMNYPVVYAHIQKLKRGRYKLFVEMLEEHPKETNDNYLTELHTQRLEKDINSEPETWIWSHRRWKHIRQLNS